MTIIDFHNHFFPPKYLEEVENGPSNIQVTFDDQNNPLLHYPGDYNIVVPGHRDIDYREKVLKKLGVDHQILTLTTPGTHLEEPMRAVELARIVNDEFAGIAEERKERFSALATLPLSNPGESVNELERAVTELGMRGTMVFSNINGKDLCDEEFWPIYEKANALGNVVIFIHPTFPKFVETMTEYWLTPLLGFTFDTSLAAAKLVFSGVVDKFPKITWVLAHLGGTIPYLAERLDRGYYAFEDCRKNISKEPSEYLKEFYYDTVNFDPSAIQHAINFAGVDHLMAGSDYPHQIGSLEQMIESINQINISEEDKNKIRSENVQKLLRM